MAGFKTVETEQMRRLLKDAENVYWEADGAYVDTDSDNDLEAVFSQRIRELAAALEPMFSEWSPTQAS